MIHPLTSNIAALLLAVASLVPAHADDLAKAAAALRAGQPAEALNLLDQAPPSVEQSFWRGRVLLELERYREAAALLAQVPQSHRLYSYAAKGLILCAQKSEELDARSILLPLTQSSHDAIARLACAALAEHNLLQKHSRREEKDSSIAEAEQLMDRAWPSAEEKASPACRLLRIYLLAQKNAFAEAQELCRILESNPSVEPTMKLRARLALAEVYYDEADAAKDPLQREEAADKAEETLLQFISANPNSPLIDVAFRRLKLRDAFRKSEYAYSKLREWSQDLVAAHRACLATYMLMLTPTKGDDSLTRSLTLANAAQSNFPNEPVLRAIQLRHADRLMTRESLQDAEVYIQQLPANDPYRLFFEAEISRDTPQRAMLLYLQCARIAPEGLYTPALVNALTCALRCGDTKVEDMIVNYPHLAPRTRAALLIAQSTYYAKRQPELARQGLEEALTLPVGTMIKAQCMLDLAALELEYSPATAYLRLEELERNLGPTHILPTESVRPDTVPSGFLIADQWTPFQLLRYLLIKEDCIRKLYANDPQKAAELVLEATRKVKKLTNDPSILSALGLFEASLLAETQQKDKALAKLNAMLKQEKQHEFRARAYLMKGRILSGINTIESLQKAIRCYEQCSKTSTWYADLATAFQASILVRFGKLQEAQQLLHRLLEERSSRMRIEIKAYAYSVLADSWALSQEENAHEEAINACATMLTDPRLPQAWRNRLLLQHATLCARYGRQQEALVSYQALLNADPVAGDHASRGDWFLLYYAGAGAVSAYLDTQQYSEAANTAERIGTWRGTFPKEFQPAGKRFLEWAKLIRRLHSAG